MSKYLALSVPALLASAVFSTATAGEEPAPTAPLLSPTVAQTVKAPPPTYWRRRGCSHVVTWKAYRHALRRTFRYSDAGGNFTAAAVSHHQLAGLAAMRRCSWNPTSHRIRLHAQKARAAQWRWHQHIDAITPYGEWAIPWVIVACESGGSWGAANPSGAVGPYQLLGHGAPWPANSPWAQARHHEIAAALYAGGLGRRAWVC